VAGTQFASLKVAGAVLASQRRNAMALATNMHVEIETKQCSISEEVRLRMQPKLEQIQQATTVFPAADLWLTIVFHPKSLVYHAQAKLKVPGQSIIVGDRNPYLDQALVRCLDKALRRVQAYQANPNREAVEQADRRAKLADGVIAPMDPDAGTLGEAVQRGDYLAFRQALWGKEEPIRKRVGRWIGRYPDIEQQVGRSLEIADLVEEVFLLAFEQYPQRPAQLTLHEWLDSLIDPAVKSYWQDPDDREAASFAQTLREKGAR
jgi:ribosome-associated translation inhibitor RaiA